MKLIVRMLVGLALALFAPAVLAQVYPTQLPVYIPTAVEQPVVVTATGDVYFTVQGLNTVSVQFTNLTGTLTASVQGTNEAPGIANADAHWSTLNMVPLNGGTTVTSVSTASTWTVASTGLTRLRVHISALSSGPVTVNLAGTPGGSVSYSAGSVVLTDAEGPIAPGTAPANALVAGGTYNSAAPTFTNGQSGSLQLNASGQLIVSDATTEGVITAAAAPTKMQAVGAVYNSAAPSLTTGQSAALQADSSGNLKVTTTADAVVAADPCQSRNVAKSSVLANISSAATTALVAVSGAKAVYVCGVSVVTGVADSVYLEYGTSTNCTGTTALTPTYGASSQVNIGWGGGTVVTAPASQGVCAVSTGTAAQQVLISYVQQ